MRKFLVIFILGLSVQSSSAGFVELGGSGNYRISKIDADNYQELLSFTGSMSYYFWEMSALELSYTEGKQIVSLKINSDPNKTVTTTIFRLAGLDLVLTLAGKESVLQPYVKVGGAYIQKEILRQVVGFGSPDRIDSPSGVVPSAGVGFKVKISQTFSIKVGVDGWSSPLNRKPVTWDYAGRAGVTWMF